MQDLHNDMKVTSISLPKWL